MTLMGRHELDATMPMPVVVPVNKDRHPLACLVLAGKRPVGVVRTVIYRTEQGF